MNRSATAKHSCLPAAFLLLLSAGPATAQTTVSVNLDYAEGKYGEPEKSTSWTMPLIVKHQAGALGLKLNVPYVRASGTAAAGGDRSTPVRQTQEGLGDVVATVTYDFHVDGDLVIDAGVKAKFAPGDKSKDLISTGENDYSLLLGARNTFGATTVFGTVGRTKKGDPEGADFRDPWFATVAFSHAISATTAWGAMYDYRQRLTPRGDPISEATLFAEHKFGERLRLQGYAIRGFSDASPDLGAGITLSVRY